MSQMSSIDNQVTYSDISEVFLSNVSHSLRTPINVILGNSHLLRATLDCNEEQAAVIDQINHSAMELLSQVNDLVDMSRIESNKMTLCSQVVNLKEVIQDVCFMISAKSDKKGLIFRYQLPEELDQSVTIDDLKIRQILLALLDNAVKFTEQGYVTLQATMSESRIMFSVTDTGIGIEDSELQRIYEPFYQTNSARHGVGLGLPICKRVVELMNGTITVKSGKDQGSVFTVTIPVPVGRSEQL
ncbi:sensor histidine kinase [Endozoicomonas lisbonensis]|uniref:histidine kinase n=1 Tax=Endozoicomonas lisbonensis TaxID=3120522 RepID=A0ABV2SD78_9GAMM